MSNHKRKFPPGSVKCEPKKKEATSVPSVSPPFLFSSKKTRESVEVMACESHEGHHIDPFSSTPPQASPSASLSPKRNPKEHDQCFLCKRLGHWSKDWPNKTPPKSLALSPGSPSSPSVQVPDLPVVRCPCGRGTCKVSTSNTVKNPGRKFYACPVDHRTSGSCGFFKWSDDIAARFKPPMCPCGAGSSSLNIVSSGPDRGRWYFACRIKKNHGACKFFQWADSEGNNMPNKHGDESKGYPARRSLFTGHQVRIVNNELCTEDNQSSDIELESTMVESVENYPNSSMDSAIRKDEVLVRDLVMQDSESCDIVAGTALEVPPRIPRPEIPCQEPEFSLQISAARHTKSEGTSPFDPVIEDVGDIEGLALLAGSSSNDDESDIQQGPFLQSPREDAEHPNGIFQEPSGTKTVVENSDTSKVALKTFGQGLLAILQSMDQTQHETMLKVAENTFDAMRHLSIDYASFSKAVREYIQCKSKLAGIEESMGENFYREEFLGNYNDKKTQFDNISQRHVEAVSAYEASENHLQALRVEVSRVKNMLLELEKQLSFCEAETLRCKSCVTEISNQKSESERSLDAACEKMEQALALEDERDSMVDAANAALENARVQLLQ